MKTFLAIFNTVPAILQSVLAVEAAVPLPQAGQQKLNLILGIAAAAWTIGQAEHQALSKSQTINAVQALTNVTVTGLNAAGVFKQSVANGAANGSSAPAVPVSSN